MMNYSFFSRTAFLSVVLLAAACGGGGDILDEVPICSRDQYSQPGVQPAGVSALVQ